MFILLPTSTLKKYCAKEVLILLERMEQRPEDFYKYDNIWGAAIDPDKEHFKHYTAAERVLILRASKEMKQKYKRAKLLGAILKETIDPENKEGMVRNPYYTGVTSPAQMQVQTQKVMMDMELKAAMLRSQATISRYDINTDTYTNVQT